MIATAFGPLIGGIATPAGTAANLVAIGTAQTAGRTLDVSFWRWMRSWRPGVAAHGSVRVVDPSVDVSAGDRSAADQRRCNSASRLHRAGPLRRGGETRTLLVFAVVVALWLITPLPERRSGGRSRCRSAVARGGVAFLPGIRVLSWKEAEAQVEWGGVMMIVAGLSLGLAGL